MNEEVFSFTVPPELDGERIDTAVSKMNSDITRTQIQKLILEGLVLSDSKPVQKNCRVHTGHNVEVRIPAPLPLEAKAQDIPISVVFEDDDLLVVNKPKGMVVHPAPGNSDGTLVNALLFHCGSSLSGINGVIRPGIVHRIDKDTSGLLIVAKNDFAHVSLASQIKEHSFTREYSAVLHGHLRDDDGTVCAPIGRNQKDRKKMAVTDKGSREATTHYHVIERFTGYTYARLRLETGRTHQIRVHMAYIGHPVAGDTVYGPKNTPTELHGQCLHAGLIGFTHPRTGEYLEFSSPLPDYFTKFLLKLSSLSN